MPEPNQLKQTSPYSCSNASSSSSFVSVDTAISSDTSPPGSPKNRTSIPRSRIPIPSTSLPRCIPRQQLHLPEGSSPFQSGASKATNTSRRPRSQADLQAGLPPCPTQCGCSLTGESPDKASLERQEDNCKVTPNEHRTRDTLTILNLAGDRLEEAKQKHVQELSRLLNEIKDLKKDKEEAEKARDAKAKIQKDQADQIHDLLVILKEKTKENTRQRREKELYCIEKEDELRESREKESHLREDHKKLQEKSDELERRLRLEESRTAAAIEAMAKSNHDLDLAHEDVRELKTNNASLQSQLTDLSTRHLSQIQHSKARALQLNTRLCALRWRNMVLLRNLQRTKAVSDELRARCDKLENEQKETSAVKELNDKLQAELRSLSTRISDSEKKYNHLQREHDTLKTTNNDLLASHDSIQMQHNNIREENASLQSQIRDSNRNRRMAFMRFIEIQRRERVLSTRLQESTAECENLRGINNDLDTVIASLQQRVPGLEKENMRMERQRNRDEEVIHNRPQQRSYERQPDERPITRAIQAQPNESKQEQNVSGESPDRGAQRYVYTREGGRHGIGLQSCEGIKDLTPLLKAAFT